jgi:alpha-beta hydrolase superfamily lysophospholipase
MNILFLHGWRSVPGGVKPTFLARHGHEVANPELPDDDFAEAIRIAQAEFDRHQPQVVVGSSRGGAVAMNINSGEARLVLLCPAWKKHGSARTVKAGTVILHSRSDDVVPFADSEELVRNSGLPVGVGVVPLAYPDLGRGAGLQARTRGRRPDRPHGGRGPSLGV